MLNIAFTSELNVVTIAIDSDATLFDNVKCTDDEIDVSLIDKMVKEINAYSNGLIIDYNYEIIDEHNIVCIVLFKHYFSKFGEIQRYAKFKTTRRDNGLSMSLTNHDIKLKIPNGCEHIPFTQLYIENVRLGDANKTTIALTSNHPIATYKNYNMFVDLSTKILNKCYSDIDRILTVYNKS
jgi:hypothetical protein